MKFENTHQLPHLHSTNPPVRKYPSFRMLFAFIYITILSNFDGNFIEKVEAFHIARAYSIPHKTCFKYPSIHPTFLPCQNIKANRDCFSNKCIFDTSTFSRGWNRKKKLGCLSMAYTDDDEIEDDFGKHENDGENVYDDSSSKNIDDSTMLRIEEQQRQIDMLMKMVQQQNQNQNNESSKKTVEIESGPLDDNVSSKLSDTRPRSSSSSSPRSQLSGRESNQNNPSLSGTSESNAKGNINVGVVAPLKAMMFIDGTWLYYSIHERKGLNCPITQKFGRGWQQHYQVDW